MTATSPSWTWDCRHRKGDWQIISRPFLQLRRCGRQSPPEPVLLSVLLNYSLFVGINVYLPRIIVRIFVDFDWIFVRIFVVWKENEPRRQGIFYASFLSLRVKILRRSLCLPLSVALAKSLNDWRLTCVNIGILFIGWYGLVQKFATFVRRSKVYPYKDKYLFTFLADWQELSQARGIFAEL